MASTNQVLNTNVSFLLFQAEAEIQKDAVAPGQKVLIIDDLLATGGENGTGGSLTDQQLVNVKPSRRRVQPVGSGRAMPVNAAVACVLQGLCTLPASC